MAEIIINNPATGAGNNSANFDSLLGTAKVQLQKISADIQNLISQQTTGLKITGQDPASGLLKVQIPQLANILPNQTEILIKTAFPADKAQGQNVNIQVQSANVIIDQGKPVLQLQGQIIQATAPSAQQTQAGNQPAQNVNIAPQKFTAEIPLTNQQGQTLTTSSASQSNTDQVIRNFLPNNTTTASANNLTQNIKTALPQTLQNINLNTQNNFNLQINSLTTPTGQPIINNPAQPVINSATPQINSAAIPTTPQTSGNIQTNSTIQNSLPNQPQNIVQNVQISGVVESFTESNEALVRTEFGTFRVANLTNTPAGSQINFTITTQAAPTAQQTTNNILNLNPTNLQALKVSLLSSDSPLQELVKNLSSAQNLSALLSRVFPHTDDKNAAIRNLMLFSASSKGAPEGWLNDEGQAVVNKIPGSDGNLSQLKELFGVLQSFAGKGQQPVSSEWNSYIIPLFDGSKLSFASIQVQRDPEGSSQKTTKGKRKFIVELEQEEFGRVALEGLYSKVEGRVNNLDMVIKTEKEVSPEIEADINRIFNESAGAYGFNGSISFLPFTAPVSPIYDEDVSKILGDGIVI